MSHYECSSIYQKVTDEHANLNNCLDFENLEDIPETEASSKTVDSKSLAIANMAKDEKNDDIISDVGAKLMEKYDKYVKK